MSKPLSVTLWLVALAAILLAALSITSLLGLVRFATVTDGSSAPVAFAGSLAITAQKPAQEVAKGDIILVGAHSSNGSTLGEVVDVSQTQSGNVAVLLKAPALSMPDQWSYELGANSYELVLAVPLIGYPFEFFNSIELPVLAVALTGLLALALLIGFRYVFFRRESSSEPGLFSSLNEESGDDELAVLNEFFQEAGVQAPEVFVEVDDSWTRRRRA